MTPTQEGEHTLENLSRMLADESVSRARALRLLGAAVVGGLLASIPGGAKAAPVVCGGTSPQECGQTCCTAEQVCCGHGANAYCCPSGATCCQKGQTFRFGRRCCPPGFPICCAFQGGGNVGCVATVAICESAGGHPRPQ
jgi:hypothetical protein